MGMLVASVTNPDEIDQVSHMADIVELRLDHFPLTKRPKCPVIFTLRKKEQGGALKISEEDRLLQIEKLLEHLPDYFDIEADTDPRFIEKIAKKFPKVKLIGSYHDFEKTPLDLDALLKGMINPHFSFYKLALQAQSTLDMLRLMSFSLSVKVPFTAISMGEYGAPSRILGKIVGNAFDYAGLTEDRSLGRYSLQTLNELFHYRKLNQQTLIYALIGDPVEKSEGHLFHNPRFDHNAVYVKLRLLGEEVPEFFQLVKKLPFGGLSVTMPLKEAVFLQMDEVTLDAKKIGSINTVTFGHEKVMGSNTDGMGALNALEKHTQVKNKQLAILGAGGTARAIAFEAKRRGAIVSIYNRTKSRCETIGKELGCDAYLLNELQGYDILINTIPEDISIMPIANTFVMDVVYSPKETALLARAKKQGCKCVYGEEMFIEQALLQQATWSLNFKNNPVARLV